MGAFRDWLENDTINEMTKKIPAEVKWKSGFGKGIGKFTIQDEDYEIEFDEFIENNQRVAGIKFFRMKNNLRVIKYVESKDPLTVSLTMKEQVKLYLEQKKPDVFGFMGDLTENARLRHYQRLLTVLSREFSSTYRHAYTTVMYEIDYRTSYDERDFYKNNERISFDEFKNVLHSNILDITKQYSSYEDEITFKIGNDTYCVWWYSGD